MHTLIVQWSAYGNDTFGGPDGWLARALRQAQAAGLKLILGLYLDPDYYQRLDQLDTPGLDSYWQYQLGRSLAQHRLLRHTWQLPLDGWYLPMELDDLHFLDASRRKTLQNQLKDFASQLDAPLHLSAFSAGKLAPSTYAGWLQDLAGLGIHVWWQDGAGTTRLPIAVRQAYAAALPCHIGIIQEAFRQTSSAGQPFHAEPSPPSGDTGCHPDAVFELRYRPWSQPLRVSHQNAAPPEAKPHTNKY